MIHFFLDDKLRENIQALYLQELQNYKDKITARFINGKPWGYWKIRTTGVSF